MRISTRVRNFCFVRQRTAENDELPWVRAKDLQDVDLVRPVVLVNGAFDVLHSGHMKILFTARARAGTLVCALDSDKKIKTAKGANRPIQSWIERAVTLSYMPIDYLVEIDTTQDMTELIDAIDPDERVQGYDYRKKASRYPWIKKCFVRDGGMRTSTIVERILKSKES